MELDERIELFCELHDYFVAEGLGCRLLPTIPVDYSGPSEELLEKRGKAPARKWADTFKSADEIREYFTRNPTANVVYMTQGLIVIDEDVGHAEGVDGRENLFYWQQENGKLPDETATAITGSGGRHTVYKNTSGLDVRNREGGKDGMLEGVDIRANGGLAVAPGSIHPITGEPYFWDLSPVDYGIAEADELVYRLALMGKGESTSPTDSNPFEAPDEIPEGQRHDTLFSMCCSMRAKGISYDATLAAAQAENRAKCKPPFPADVVEALVKDVFTRYQAGFSEEYRKRAEEAAARARAAYSKPAGSGRTIGEVIEEAGLTPAKINDKQLSRLFARCYADSLKYVPELNSWLAYDGKRWRENGGRQLAELRMKELIDGLAVWAAQLEDADQRAAAMKSAGKYSQFRNRNNCLADAQSELTSPLAKFDTNSNLLNVRNGTIDFSNGEPVFREHSPADMVTRIAPVDFSPDADCELYRQTLAQAFEGDCEMMAYFQKVAGLIVAGDASQDETYFLGELHRTSKTTLTLPLVALLGKDSEGYARQVAPATFAVKKFADGSRPSGDIARLEHARLVLTAEPPQGMELDCGLVKALCGFDLITARENFKSDRSFQFRGILVLVANAFPCVNDPSLFDSGRVKVIPFCRQVPKSKRDTSLRPRLCKPAELSGILNWALDGYRLFKAEGMNPPEQVVEATAAYQKRSDVLASFLADAVEVDESAKVKAIDLFEAYSAWVNESPARVSIGRGEFYSRMRRKARWLDRATVDGVQARNVIAGLRLRKSGN